MLCAFCVGACCSTVFNTAPLRATLVKSPCILILPAHLGFSWSVPCIFTTGRGPDLKGVRLFVLHCETLKLSPTKVQRLYNF